MGFRSQFESLLRFHSLYADEADIYMVYGREAFPQEARWPAPVPDGRPVSAPTVFEERLALVTRFANTLGNEVPFLVDDLSDAAMGAYDAYPFRIYGIDPDGTIAVPSGKGAHGFEPTLQRLEAWLQERSVAAGAESAPEG